MVSVVCFGVIVGVVLPSQGTKRKAMISMYSSAVTLSSTVDPRPRYSGCKIQVSDATA